LAKKQAKAVKTAKTTKDSVQLSDLILTLREAIDDAARKREQAGLDPFLYVHEANVQVQVQFVKEKKVKGGVKIYLADIGAEGKEQTGTTNTLSLTFKAAPEDAQRSDRMAGTTRHDRD